MRAILTIATASLLSMAANATAWDFFLNMGSRKFSGTVAGTLQGDNNTVVVNSFTNVVVSGQPQSPLLFVANADSFILSLPDAPAVVSLDGSQMNFLACPDSNCFESVYVFGSGTALENAFGIPLAVFSFNTDSFQKVYIPANWSMTLAVPEPANWAMLIAGFGLAGAVMRRRRTLLAP